MLLAVLVTQRSRRERHRLQNERPAGVQFLTEAGLVRTIRGARGGVMLARTAGEIRVGEVVRSNEQDQALVECFRADGGACTLLPRCQLRGMLAGAKKAFYEYLDRYTLADCLAGAGARVSAPSTHRTGRVAARRQKNR